MTKNLHNLKDCMYEPDNTIKTTSNLDGKNKLKSMSQKTEPSPPSDAEITFETLMETVDLSDLTFSSNDFMLDDCTCFEQASQLVDPALKDSESTPFRFNNSDSVQLFRYSLTENTEDSLSNLVKYSDNLSNKNSDKCKMVCVNDDMKKNDHFDVYHVLELLDSKMNVNKDSKNINGDSVQCRNKKSGRKKSEKSIANAPIKKGRQYLPNFKQKVLDYTRNHTFKETALHFKINRNTITEWSRESKGLSIQNNNISMPGSDCKNYKTDINGTPDSKTEIILLTDVMNFETDFNEPSKNNVENDLPPIDMQPDERFIKWIRTKRLERQSLSSEEVFHMAKSCLRVCAQNQDKSWFVKYLKRFNRALKGSVTSAETEKCIKYPVNFKLEVALYARIFSKNSAAKAFNVSRKRIFDWFNCLKPLKDSFAVHGKSETGVKTEVVEEKEKFAFTDNKVKNKIYLKLHRWYQKTSKNGSGPSSYEIKEKAKEIFSSHGITAIKFSDGWLQKFCQRMNIKLRHREDDRLLLWVLTQLDNNVSLSHQEITEKSSSLIGKKTFKGSKGWTLRFLKRHRNLLQRLPTARDELPAIVQEKLDYFWDSFRHSLVSLPIEPASIGCLDEIPLWFNYPEDGKSRLPLLRKTGFKNCQGVVLLCSLACGRVLPPAVVFAGSGPKQLFSDRDVNILVLFQEKGFVTVDILETWFNNIWLSCVPTPSTLVVDSFKPHCSLQFRQLLAREKCKLHIIPEGCSSRFQPLNVETTPLFKETVKKQWNEFSSNPNTELLRRNRYPDQNTILGWVRNAYDKIERNPISITNSFKTTGLLQ